MYKYTKLAEQFIKQEEDRAFSLRGSMDPVAKYWVVTVANFLDSLENKEKCIHEFCNVPYKGRTCAYAKQECPIHNSSELHEIEKLPYFIKNESDAQICNKIDQDEFKLGVDEYNTLHRYLTRAYIWGLQEASRLLELARDDDNPALDYNIGIDATRVLVESKIKACNESKK